MRYWVPVVDQVEGKLDAGPVVTARSVHRVDETPPPEHWRPGEPWLPPIRQRGATKDWRVGYRHAWKLQDYTSKPRRPYLLRMDLARVPPKDSRPVEELLVKTPIPLVSTSIVTEPPPDWPGPLRMKSPMGLAPPVPRVEPPMWRSIMADDRGGAGGNRPVRPGAAAGADGWNVSGSGSMDAEGMSGGEDG